MNDAPLIDRENAFMLYAAFTGDLERTAHAIGVRSMDVLRMADEDRWNDKLKGILELTKSSKPGDVERGINRAINFVEAHRLRLVIERAIARLTGMSVEEFEEYLFTSATDKNGNNHKKLTTRALADLASALEKAHSLSYMALSDTAQDRAKRNEAESGGGIPAGEMHVKIAEAMRKAGASNTPRAQLFDAQLQIGQSMAVEMKKPEPIEDAYDNDQH